MLGIIATIVAACRGHKEYALFVGIWTAVAFILAFAGVGIALAPGPIFLIIAFSLKKDDPPYEAPAWKKTALDYNVVGYCPSCGEITMVNNNCSASVCPNCHTDVYITSTSEEKWMNMLTKERNEMLEQWKRESATKLKQ